MNNKTLFKHEQLQNNLYRIYDASDTIIYLIIGKKCAAVIDTGYGLGDLREYVGHLTELPLIALITHAHRDHAMGALQFEAYMNRKDYAKYENDCTMERRKEGMRNAQKKFCNGLYERASDEDWFPVKPVTEFHDLKDGDRFALGGVSVEAYELPGHSEGEMIFLIPEERILILGDACGWDTRIFCRVGDYYDALRTAYEKVKGRFDKAFSSHSGGDLPENIMEGQMEVCKEVLDGVDDKLPFVHPDAVVFQGKDMRIAKRLICKNRQFHRLDGGVGGLVYDANLI